VALMDEYEPALTEFLQRTKPFDSWILRALPDPGCFVLEKGPEESPVTRIVIKAASTDEASLNARWDEIRLFRTSQDADAGIYVASPSRRDIGFLAAHVEVFLFWDPDEPRTDILLEAGLNLAASCCLRVRAEKEAEIKEALIGMLDAMDMAGYMALTTSRSLEETPTRRNLRTRERHITGATRSLRHCLNDLSGKTEELRTALLRLQ